VLTVHRAERAGVLADALAALLARPLADPFAGEVVAVPAKGVERWLTQRLSGVLGAGTACDGVAAGIAFPSPSRLVDEAVAAASGLTAQEDPWAPQRVLWALLDVVDGCVGEPWCAVLSGHLGHGAADQDHRAGRRYATAEHLRDLFRAYGASRPAMLVAWARGESTDGTGAPLPDDVRWQAEVWRRARAVLAAPSPAERLEQTCRRLRGEPAVSELPERLSLFGATRTTTEQRAVLTALAEHRDVHLWLPHPSPALWEQLRGRSAPVRRSADTSALDVRSPLLASLGRDTRELQLLLGPVDDVHHPAPARERTLLAAVQAAVRDDAVPTAVATADGTVQVHACHGLPRQVEVLREVLLHLLEDDPTLEPRDVLVMCPDVEAAAPLVRAAFGQPDGAHPGHRLRVRLADRSLRRTNPLLDVLAALLELADGRVTAGQVLDLAASPPVRRAFSFSDDELERLRDWVGRAGVRWGLGPQQRAAFSLQGVPQGTWATGLDRVLLGVAADESELEWLDLALPLDDVDSSDIDLAGRLAELLQRLGDVLDRLGGPAPLRDWLVALTDALDLLTSVPDADAWQLGQARRALADAAEHGLDAELRLADLRLLLRGRLAGRPTRANFRTGELTVCTMVPMRSVPHRVVALLGLDDGVFPRAGSVDGDDVLARDPCLGERDVRSEDRQLLLDAVLSAGDSLVLLHTGADAVTGARRPPAVPLGELLDVLRATVGDESLEGVLHRHPLQPFDGRDFRADEPFSHDERSLAGARAAAGSRVPARPLLVAPLPPRGGDVALADLVAVLVSPAQAFLRQRLGVVVPDREEAVREAVQVELDGLEAWDVGERMLASRLAGVDPADFRQAEWRRGTLPPGPLGLRLLTELEGAVEPLAAAALRLPTGVRRALDVVVDLGDGRRLSGTVGGLSNGVLVSASYSRVAPKHRLTAWARLLAVAASGHSGAVSRAVTLGRGPYRRPAWQSVLQVPDDPLPVLRDLVALHDDGLRAPLPLVAGASSEYAARRERGSSVQEALAAAQASWNSPYGGDGSDRHVVRVHGPSPSLDGLLVEPGVGEEPTRFGALARRLWAPLLGCEQMGAP
jgi:exodeoxyribonuclease V gamma subunit